MAGTCSDNPSKLAEYAHGQGVLHRDLKPSNILVNAEGVPLVTDFGLAKLAAHESELTRTGQFLGSPGYAPPEQATVDGNADRRGDVYGLGAILYYALTGRPPFEGATAADVVAQVRDRDAISPCQFNRQVPRDLETICLKWRGQSEN